jgi:ABC-2 type transport system permease protein
VAVEALAPPAARTTRAQWGHTRVPAQVWILTARAMRTLVLDPRMIVAKLLGPLVTLLVLSQVFATIADAPDFPPGVSYLDFLVPAIMLNSVLQSALQTGRGLSRDMHDGIVARFRALPVWPGSLLLARSLADLARSFLQLVSLLLVAWALLGFSPAGGVTGVILAAALALAVGWGVGWAFIALACWIRNAELVDNVSGLLLFPLLFASNAFVPLERLPGWLHALASVNPMTHAIQAARDLTLGHPAAGGVLAAVAISLPIALASAALAVRGFRRPL